VDSLSILMPVFNERATAARAVDEVLEANLPVDAVELIVVDDGSTDGTAELLAERAWPEGTQLIRHDRNRGKGAALRTALAQASGEYVAVMDADLEYAVEDIGKLLEPLAAGDADAVFGTRGFRSHSAYGFWYVMGNRVVTLSANVLFNSWLSDIMTCHKVMRTDLMRSLPLREQGFGIEPEITARLLRARARVYEVPVVYRARRREEGKKLTALDGLRVLRTLVRCRLT
jgi:glycosyltransferase involved in cell wall biosynthesis